jgi:hypothetical protein
MPKNDLTWQAFRVIDVSALSTCSKRGGTNIALKIKF